MNKNLESLAPALVWKHFARIAAIPRPSGHEEAIRAYVLGVARSLGLECREDEAHNVYVRKPATPGMENRKGVILQAHLDMVPQKNNDKEFDFEKDPIEAYIDGEWVTADGTTLGADDGIGVAAILAVLEDDTIRHGELEALFTATEETGMDGAFGLKAGVLKGDILLNLDSETEGEFYVGCAGGLDANAEFRYNEVDTPADYTAYTLTVKGLKGGHSGIQIITQRANANVLLFRLLESRDYPVEIASVDGGGLRNAIPREATATVLVPADRAGQFEQEVAAYEAVIVHEFAGIEENISIKAVRTEHPARMIDPAVTLNLKRAVILCPDGVQRMSVAMPGLVQTSNNLARVVSDGRTVRLQCLMRSSMNTEKEALGRRVAALFEMAGAEVELSGSYDGWNPDMASPILKAMRESYPELFGSEPVVTAIHAGLECGVIGSNYPAMDMVSFGPTICYPHSPDEKVEIASVDKFYRFLVHTVEHIPAK